MNSNTEHHTISSARARIGHAAERAANAADDMLEDTRRAASEAARSVHNGIDDLRDSVPATVSRVAAQAEDLTRRGVDRAVEAAHHLRERSAQLGDATVHRIQNQPVKAVMIAAAAGAAIALLTQWLSRPQRSR